MQFAQFQNPMGMGYNQYMPQGMQQMYPPQQHDDEDG